MDTFLRALSYTVAGLCLLAAIAVLWFASFEQLALSKGLRSRNSGPMFVGMVAVFGEPLARLLVSSMFVACAWLLWPKRRKRKGTSKS
jgi:hypothetical protein